jgi:ankyrin repeat protein
VDAVTLNNTADESGLGDLLLDAASEGDIELIRECIRGGANINTSDGHGDTALSS